MLLSTLSLVTAVSAFSISKQQINSQKDVFEKCTIIRNHDGDTIYDCPGCVLIIDKDGSLKLRTGEECHKYRDDSDDERATTFQGDNCQIIKQPNGDTLTQCPGCQKIVDKNGKTKLEQGPNCRKSQKDFQILLKEVYESGLLAIQE